MKPCKSFVKTCHSLFSLSFLVLALSSGALAQEAPERVPRLVSPWLELSDPAMLQARSAQRDASRKDVPFDSTVGQSTRKLVGGGMLGVVTGLAAGYGAGALLFSGCSGESCSLGAGAVAIGTGAGTSALLVPLGVHLANGRQGNYGWSALASSAIAVTGLVGSVLLLEDNTGMAGVTMLSIPVLQLVSSISIERATARKRQARRDH